MATTTLLQRHAGEGETLSLIHISFAAKRELVNVFLATHDRIIVVDPMGEYSPLLCKFVVNGWALTARTPLLKSKPTYSAKNRASFSCLSFG